MNPLLVYFIVSTIAITIGCGILKIIFGKSILFKVSILTVTAMYVTCFLAFYSGVKGMKSLFWTIPTMAGYSVFIFIVINRIRKRLEKLTHQLQEFSQGSLKVELTSSLSKDETGRLNNTIVYMLEQVRKMYGDFNNSAVNLVTASQQTLNASRHLSESSYKHAMSVSDIMTEIEHIQIKIQNNKEISKEANNSIQQSVNVTQMVLEMDIQLEEKINQIRELSLRNATITPELISDLSHAAKELTQKTIAIMKESVVRIHRMSKLTNEAYNLCEDESNSIDTIRDHMEKLDIMAQQNAMYSVELTACSEMLKEEAERLNSIMSIIKTYQL